MRSSAASASARWSASTPARASRSSTCPRDRSRYPNARAATSRGSDGCGCFLFIRDGRHLDGTLLLREEPGGDHLLRRCLRLDGAQDPLHHVGMLLEERRRVLAALAEALVAEGEVRARLLDDLPVEAGVEHRAFPGDAVAVDDVELRLLERRGDLVLHHLHADAVADRLDAVLQRLDPADVEPHGGVEPKRASAGGRLRVAEHDADLLAQLVREE